MTMLYNIEVSIPKIQAPNEKRKGKKEEGNFVQNRKKLSYNLAVYFNTKHLKASTHV